MTEEWASQQDLKALLSEAERRGSLHGWPAKSVE